MQSALEGRRDSSASGLVEIAGPETFRLDDLIRQALSAGQDPRAVVADSQARYFGAIASERALVPEDSARLGEMRFQDWLSRPA
jgi:hypothetical protein